MSPSSCDVLIVGAGPVGLTLAALLRRQGVSDVRIIDKAAAPSQTSKALVIWQRTLELLDKADLAAPLLAHGTPLHGADIHADGRRLLHVSFGLLPSPYTAALGIPQSVTERVLGERLTADGLAVEREVELIGITDDGQGVDALLRQADGSQARVRARWLIGCDGAHSTVRHLLGLPFEGHTLDSTWALADVDLEGDAPHDEVGVFWERDGLVAVFPMGGGRFRIVADLTSDGTLAAEPTLAQMQTLVDARVRRGWRLTQAHWLSRFAINERKVRDYSRGRVHLAGDAAHIHSPAGGQGMNTGMQDAANLAWKLALTVRGQATPTLLESYSAERSPVGDEVVAQADSLTSVATLRGTLQQQVRNQVLRLLDTFHLVSDRVSKVLSELSIGYPNSPVVGQHRTVLTWSLARGAAPGSRMPDAPLSGIDGRSPSTLFAVLQRPRHVLLMLTGLHPDDHDTDEMLRAEREVREIYGAIIDVVLVSTTPLDEWDGEGWLDAGGALHRALGAGHATVYVVRPDGYVGFRSQPVDRGALAAWCARIFLPAPLPRS